MVLTKLGPSFPITSVKREPHLPDCGDLIVGVKCRIGLPFESFPDILRNSASQRISKYVINQFAGNFDGTLPRVAQIDKQALFNRLSQFKAMLLVVNKMLIFMHDSHIGRKLDQRRFRHWLARRSDLQDLFDRRSELFVTFDQLLLSIHAEALFARQAKDCSSSKS
ncbi:hypothetical protein [Rubripirellula lacrimiformis]|uniref:hypothetical protein n=1 Tax=Rubripirellula lacrimiformis TaxID=1930273 RepID=UPI001C54E120|nr:hypothetical protein [Rubripirellula lacrimiformis]